MYRDPTLEALDPDEMMRDYPAVEYVPPNAAYSLDLLTRLGEAFSWKDLDAGAQEQRLGELVVRVASPEMLYRMKRDTVRLKDRADAARLREAFGLGSGGTAEGPAGLGPTSALREVSNRGASV